MTRRRAPTSWGSIALLTSAIGLQCCSSPPAVDAAAASTAAAQTPTDLKSMYAQPLTPGARIVHIEPEKSSVRIHVFRGGQAAKVGHNHVLSAPTFAGACEVPPVALTTARCDFEFRLDQLEVDNAAHRAALGKAYASVLSAEAIAGTREHMLGADNMQADRFPFVRLHSLSIVGESPKLAAEVQIEMHGQQRRMWIPLTVQSTPNQLSVAGSVVLRQTDFGVHPYSVLGGLLAVEDAVVVEFSLVGQ